MSDPLHPVNDEWVMYDPVEVHPPLGGENLLLLNAGGVLIQGPWHTGCLAWARKPRVPDSVKRRITAAREARIADERALREGGAA